VIYIKIKIPKLNNDQKKGVTSIVIVLVIGCLIGLLECVTLSLNGKYQWLYLPIAITICIVGFLLCVYLIFLVATFESVNDLDKKLKIAEFEYKMAELKKGEKK
jgi:cell division protein FtsW (lipid II flippase)